MLDHQKNLWRLVAVLKNLETAGEDDTCIVCGARTYRDAAVVIREGCWIAPASFHANGCKLAKEMKNVEEESIPEEIEEDRRVTREIAKQFFAERNKTRK